MRKKMLTIGMVTMFIVVFFIPLSIATTPSNTMVMEEPVPAATTVYARAIVNGTIEDPHSIYFFVNILNSIIGHKLMVTANFTEGTIEAYYKIPIPLPIFNRTINIPGDYSLAKIHGALCTWNKFEQIGGTNTYSVDGTIILLNVDLY